MYLGEELDNIIDAIINNQELAVTKKNRFQTGVSVLTDFSKDNNDRNRTSPFAFTGNKFEFRGVGSSQSIAIVNTVLNGMLAIEMKEMSDLIDQGNAPIEVIRKFLKDHKRIIFNGDGYSKEWEEEAKKRGLMNIKNSVDAIESLKDDKNIKMLTELVIFSDIEIESRYEISLENYCKKMNVEAATAIKMVNNQFYPSSLTYLTKLSASALTLAQTGVNSDYIINDVKELSSLLNLTKQLVVELQNNVNKVKNIKTLQEKAVFIKDNVLKLMNDLRKVVDEVETKVDSKDWPVPTYVDLLFSI